MTPAIEMMPASQLSELPESLFPRYQNSGEHIAALADALRAGEELPPILIDKNCRVVDGFHRWKAHTWVGGPNAPVPCIRKIFASDKELFLVAVGANARHGLRLDTADQRKSQAIAARLGLGSPELAESLSKTMETMRRIEEESRAVAVPGKGDAGAPGPAVRAAEMAASLLGMLRSGKLRQNAPGLKKDFDALLAAIEAFLARAGSGEDWEPERDEPR